MTNFTPIYIFTVVNEMMSSTILKYFIICIAITNNNFNSLIFVFNNFLYSLILLIDRLSRIFWPFIIKVVKKRFNTPWKRYPKIKNALIICLKRIFKSC